jgi:pyruvate formate lyase activating enzyme
VPVTQEAIEKSHEIRYSKTVHKNPYTGDLTRRHFLTGCGMAAAAVACAGCGVESSFGAAPEESLHEALFYDKLEARVVRCRLCPRGCVIPPGKHGFCRARENRDGTLRSLVYGRPVALNIDPIEKKPFFHVRPGSQAFSMATVGCNIACKFCQNYDISQAAPADVAVPFRTPAEIASRAKASGCGLLAFTYTEPTIYYEYMADCARAARDLGLGSVMVSNGYMSEPAMTALTPLLTAIKIDLKSFSDSFYKDVCGGRLQPVLDNLKRLAASGVWTEVVTLVIPTLNDRADEIQRLAAWVAKEMGPHVPLHFSRFTPMYRMRNLPPTPYDTLRMARTLALKEGCQFVYIGNAAGLGGEDTACPACGEIVIKRIGNRIESNRLKEGNCPACGKKVAGIWS